MQRLLQIAEMPTEILIEIVDWMWDSRERSKAEVVIARRHSSRTQARRWEAGTVTQRE